LRGGKFGGNFIPETLKKPVEDLTILSKKISIFEISFSPEVSKLPEISIISVILEYLSAIK
jgi:tryptophan synthase beta subunit